MQRIEPTTAETGLRFPHTIPVDLDTHTGQETIRQTAWALTEELVEFSQKFEEEELIDVGHFVVELMILADVPPMTWFNGIKNDWPWVVECLGRAMNMLKRKAWKKNAPPLDKERFRAAVADVWIAYVGLCNSNGVNQSVFEHLYKAKNEVNLQRQENNY